MGKKKVEPKADSAEAKGVPGKTLFVRNLPYTATNDTLEKVFGEYGPLKGWYVVGSAADSQGNCKLVCGADK